jgi:hypothetical protein
LQFASSSFIFRRGNGRAASCQPWWAGVQVSRRSVGRTYILWGDQRLYCDLLCKRSV